MDKTIPAALPRLLWPAFWLAILLCALLLTPLPGAAGTLPDSAYIPGFIGHAQTFALSCEARSAVDLAAFWGVQIDEAEFLYGLPSSDNPEIGFVGNANGYWGNIPPSSYGVHAEPVAVLLQAYGIPADAHKGMSWNDLRAEITAGRPVIVWVIGAMWSGYPVSYTAVDGKNTTVASFEHTMTLIGYDENQVHVVDSYSGWTQVYPLETFLASWAVLGNMGVTTEEAAADNSESEAAPTNTYSVQRGDYLEAVAKRFNTTWQELARLNSIAYPYTIYPGQELQLPGQSDLIGPQPAGEAAGQPSVVLPYRTLLPLIASNNFSPAAPEQPAEMPTPQPAPPEPPPPEPETYEVQPGEYLIGLAERFGMDWRELADLNGVTYPYVIYPGQILKLK